MSIDVSYRLHVTSGDLDRGVTLPELPGAGTHSPGVLDRMGEQLQGAWPLVAAGSIGGGVIGSKLLRIGGGGIFRGIIGGIAGVLGGAALTMLGSALVRGDGHHSAPDVPANAAAPSTGVATREKVKVMTWNIHGGMGGPGEFFSSSEEMDRLAEVVRREQPDVLLLQEVDEFAARSNLADNLADLDERLDPDSTVAAGAATSILGRDQHTAVMTFNGFTISDARNIVHQDPRGGGLATRTRSMINQIKGVSDHLFDTNLVKRDDDYQVRNTIEAMVRTPGGSDVRVLSGHYEWPNARFDHQELEVGALSRAVAAWHGPTIWGADFNINHNSGTGRNEVALMAAAGLHDTLEGASNVERLSLTNQLGITDPNDPAARGGGIDRIYASSHARVLDSHVVRSAGDSSDHLPVVSELELVPIEVDPPAAG